MKNKSLEKLEILIVEDEPAMLLALNDTLTRQGFSVTQARNGVEGLEIALRDHPDLILLDIIMPKMDGMTMLSKLREDASWGKDAKVMILTNLSDEEKVEDSKKQNVFDYLVKTEWTLSDITRKIRDRLGLPWDRESESLGS